MGEISREAVGDLVGKVYQAAIDDSRWQQVVDELGKHFDGAHISLQGHDFATNRHLGVLTAGFAPEYVASFQQHYASINPWAAGMARSPVGETILTDPIVPREELVKGAFYNEWLAPQRLISGVGVVGYRSRLRFLALAANLRDRDEERLSGPMERTFNLLGPHLRQVFRMSRMIAGAELGAPHVEALDRLAMAAFLIDRAGKVTRANPQGRLFQLPDEGYVEGAIPLRFYDPAATKSFSLAIAAITERSYNALAGTFAIRSRDGGPNATATLVPLVRDLESSTGFLDFVLEDRPIALLLIAVADLAAEELNQRLAGFGFTAAEQTLTRALLEGHSLQQYADRKQLSIHTVRNQLRSVFTKAGVRRQGELIALLRR